MYHLATNTFFKPYKLAPAVKINMKTAIPFINYCVLEMRRMGGPCAIDFQNKHLMLILLLMLYDLWELSSKICID